ncbi:MAG: choice-of-anchor Q domain-containing protein [Zavarzinella sp.]
MLLISKLAQLFQSSTGNSTQSRRLQLESLEDRAVPATFTVNTLVDENDGIDVGNVSLREAIAAANTTAGADTINFSVTGTIILGSELVLTETGAANITTINGPANGVTISGNNAVRVLDINNDVHVAVNNLTIVDGKSSVGGAIRNNGGTLLINNSTFRNNWATTTGGAIRNVNGSLSISNSTFSANRADTAGAAIYNDSGSTLSLNHSTITGSTGIALFNDNLVEMVNSIIANSTTSDLFRSAGTLNGTNNVIESIAGTGGTNNLTGTITADPNLSVLGSFGGPTQTHIPLAGSPALNAGNPLFAPLTDQRGLLRDSTPDIGAVELTKFTVDELTDISDGNISKGNLSLREAVDMANSNPGANTIEIAKSGVITLGSQLTLTETGAANLTTINGPTNGVTISGNNAVRVLTVNISVHAALNNLTIANGNSGSNAGGGILNDGRLTISNSTVSNNSTTNFGGGIRNGGTLTISNSTLSGNRSNNDGAAIDTSGELTLNHTTISNSISIDTANGAAVWVFGGSVTVNNSIIANTTGGAGGADIFRNTGTLNGSNNIIEVIAGTGGTNNLTGTITADPMLGVLADNGGPTQTHSLLAGSPAINAATGVSPLRDQRGMNRLGTADIGAFEQQPSNLYVDFGPGFGLYQRTPTSFSRLNSNQALEFLQGKDGTLFINFGAAGLYSLHPDTGYKHLHIFGPQQMMLGDDGFLYLNYGAQYGLYRWSEPTGYEFINPNPPKQMLFGPDGFLYLSYSFGLYRWSKTLPGNNFELINANSPDNMIFGPDGMLYIDFGAVGLWRWSKSLPGTNFELINTNNPDTMVFGPEGMLYIDFGAVGLWRWSKDLPGNNFEQLNTNNADSLYYGTDGFLYIDFGVIGLWRWSKTLPGTNFELINTNNPESMVMGNDGILYIDFGGVGLWQWSKALPGNNFVLLNPNNPTRMLAS